MGQSKGSPIGGRAFPRSFKINGQINDKRNAFMQILESHTSEQLWTENRKGESKDNGAAH